MRFVVPQIERETPVVGPLTLKQFIFVGVPGAITLFLWLFWGQKNFWKFFLICFPLDAIGIVLAFVKVGGRFLPTFIADFLKYNLFPKTYFWKRKEKMLMKTFTKEMKVEQKKPLYAMKKESQITKIKSRKGVF